MSDDPPEQPENITETITPGEDVPETITGENNRDINNTLAIVSVLDPLSDRIEELGSTAEELFLDGQQDSPKVIEYSTLLHEIHSLSLSYLEAATVQLCRHYLETRSAPIGDILQEINKSIVHPETGESIEYEKHGMADDVVSEYPDEIEQQCHDILQHIENLSFGGKKRLLYKAEFSTKKLSDSYERVKKRRDSYVHTPEDLLNVRSVTTINETEVLARDKNRELFENELYNNSFVEPIQNAKEKSSLSGVHNELKDISEFEFMEVQVYDCLMLSREIDAMIDENLPYEEDLYRRLRKK